MIKKINCLTIFLIISMLTIVFVPVYSQTSIVQIAVDDPNNFSTLVATLTAANLVDTLNGPGPFTVFAPTNDAFQALPDGVVDYLLSDIPALTDVLLFHVVSGEYSTADLSDAGSVITLQGDSVVFSSPGKINDANIIISNIQASNGIIHVIDEVLVPEEEADVVISETSVVEIAVADPDTFSTLVAAVTAANLVDTLNGPGPFTVFAPTNDAFDALPDGVVEFLLGDIPALTDVLLFHVVSGEYSTADLSDAGSVITLQGDSLIISGNMVNDANIIASNIQAGNGIIHVIDEVLVPEETVATNDAIINIVTSTGGTTNPLAGSYSYPEGTAVTLIATPNAGFEFQYWIVSGEFAPGQNLGEPNEVIENGQPTGLIIPRFAETDFLIFTDNPAQITCGFGYIYQYQAVFTPIAAAIQPPTMIEVETIDPLQDFSTQPTIEETTVIGITTTIGGTTTPSVGRYLFADVEPNFSLTAVPNSGYEFQHWVVTGDYMPGHGGDPSLDTNVIPNNPLQVVHGSGYSYNYEAVFTLIEDTNGTPDGNGTPETPTHVFGLSNDAITALLIILIIAVIAAVAFGFYAYNRKK